MVRACTSESFDCPGNSPLMEKPENFSPRGNFRRLRLLATDTLV